MDFYTRYRYLIIPIILWILIQTFKFLYELIVNHKLNFKRLIGAGGMPSSHSAVVVAITTMIAKEYGADSAIFALSFVFASVVMYDAAGIRRAAGKQAKMLNKIAETPGLTNLQMQEKLVEVLGHTPVQVFVGALIGLIIGIVA